MEKEKQRLSRVETASELLLIGLLVTSETPVADLLQNMSNQVAPISIITDSSREGWDDTDPYASDPPGDTGDTGQIDWRNVSVAHNCDDLYIRYQLEDGPPFGPDGYRYNLYIDADRSRATGFRGRGKALSIGADVLIQGGQGRVSTFKFQGGTDQEAWGWQQTHFYAVGDNALVDGGRDIEYRIQLSDLNAFDRRVTSFDWVASADYSTPVSDVYPDSGNLSDNGSFYTYTMNYLPRDEEFINPERGVYESTETHSSMHTPLDLDTLQCYRQNEGTTLIHRYFYLENFVNSDISQEYLDQIQSDFDTVRQAGLKVVPRFAYSASSPTPPYGDASKERILGHIDQLSPILIENSDVIAVMQAGFIGLWGEWWYSDHFQPETDWKERADVLFAILDALPSTRMVQVRTPRYKQQIFAALDPVVSSNAHTGSDLSRTAHHNDCFVSSLSDGGTYTDPVSEYPYLEEETKWVPIGGETCDHNFLADPIIERRNCDTVLDEMSKLHWSFLNLDWYTPTLRTWLEHGCLSEIEQRLGYRLVLSHGRFDDLAWPGGDFRFRFQVTNEGFAAPYNPRELELILRHTDGSIWRTELNEDPRFWLPDVAHIIAGVIHLPEDMPVGNYQVLINLPDPEPALRDRPEYSIRLAGENIWESETGYNRLNRAVAVRKHRHKHRKHNPPRCDTYRANIYVDASGIIVGGPDDGLTYGYHVKALRGTDGSDVIVGTNEPDIIRGRGGRDTICGLDGDDTLYGDGGSDNLFGGNGNDILSGGKGPDQLNGDDDEDTLNGNDGEDELFGGTGIDIANGDGGWDFCTSSENVNTCEE